MVTKLVMLAKKNELFELEQSHDKRVKVMWSNQLGSCFLDHVNKILYFEA